MSVTASAISAQRPLWREYLELCKPRVVVLIVFTALIGMLLAVPGEVPLLKALYATVGIALAAAAAAAINHVADHRIDALMARTRNRPLPQGEVGRGNALVFAFILSVISMGLLSYLVNPLTAVMTFLSLVGYAFVYTSYLKRATPQNIVIGGAAGAAPPVLGWTAMTGTIDPHSLLLFLIIFAWTPPHFWALAVARREEYAKAEVPMLPVTHGPEFTRLQVLLYTLLMCAVTVLPFATYMSGWLYLVGTLVLNGIFLYYAIELYRTASDRIAMSTFKYSIVYLAALFALLCADRYLMLLING